jgi:hypothetical protein
MPEQLGRMMHTEETVVVSDSANLARVSMFHVCRWELPYDNDGLALVLLSGVLVRGGRNDLGQADRYSIVSWCIVRRSTLVVLRGRLILDIIRRRRTVLLKGASVRPGHCQHLKTRISIGDTYGPGTCTGVPTA